jgi:hypothetical protein
MFHTHPQEYFDMGPYIETFLVVTLLALLALAAVFSPLLAIAFKGLCQPLGGVTLDQSDVAAAREELQSR